MLLGNNQLYNTIYRKHKIMVIFGNCHFQEIRRNIIYYQEIRNNYLPYLISINSYVGEGTSLCDQSYFIKEHIELLSIELKEQSLKYKFDPIIYLYIYSPGGDLYMGFSGYEFIKNSKVPIYTYIDGMIASAATFLFLAGEKS